MCNKKLEIVIKRKAQVPEMIHIMLTLFSLYFILQEKTSFYIFLQIRVVVKLERFVGIRLIGELFNVTLHLCAPAI